MDPRRAQTRRALLVVVSVVAAAVVAPRSEAQVDPGVASPTTTTASPSTTSTTTTAAPPSSGGQFSGASQAPPGAKDAGGDGAAAPEGGIRVPPEAQRIIDSVKRSGPNNDSRLLAMLPQLETFGISEAEAYRIGMGRFPIAGPAHFSDDWLYPRFGPGFRFHLGCDIFAPYGTPVRAPVDGVARTGSDPLGGLSIKVVMPDGTFFYMAHLSGLVSGFTDGMTVATGDIVGFVGDSGNARGGAPHVHFGIYPRGAAPVDPKPILDRFLADAEARIPDLVAALQAQTAQPSAANTLTDSRRLRPMLATGVLRPFTAGSSSLPAELLYLVGANPVDGPRALVDLALTDLMDGIDWSTR